MLVRNNLDDMRFDELLQSAREKISEYLPQWTDINTHDPGVTLTELFIWLTEQQRFYMNQSEDAYPFFPLLGIRLKRACAASASIEIPGGFAPRKIDAGTPLYAEDVRFETVEDIMYEGKPLTVCLIQREIVRTPIVLGYARGFPQETFEADIKGQIILDFELSVEGEAWSMTDEFGASRPNDKHYTLNHTTGEITFGDGIHGALPYGEVEITAMSLTRGPGGNIAPERLSYLDGLPVSQPMAAQGGALPETVPHALRRYEREREQAATAEDIEKLVYNTPCLDIVSVKAFEQDNPPELGEPRIITIAVKLRDGQLTQEQKSLIRDRLEPYRLVCREFVIAQAKTVRVMLMLEIRAMPHGAHFKDELESAVRAYFDRSFNVFGAALRISELRNFVLDVPEVADVTHCSFKVYGSAKTSPEGDVTLEPDVIAELSEVSVRIIT